MRRDPIRIDSPREILRFQSGHRVFAFHRGREAIDAMVEAIERAKHTVHLETYIFRTDRTGMRILDSLTRSVSRGVAVRLIFDAIGSLGVAREAINRLREHGAEVVEFNPPSKWLWRFRPRQRDHRKMLLVDSSVGFLGGLNIGDEYVAEDEAGPTWRDAHLRIEGPALSEMQALFLENWFRCGGSSFPWRALVAGSIAASGDQSVAILADGPMYRRRRLRSMFLDELRRAKRHVLLVSPYFAPGTKVLEALEAASERGVRVELLLAGCSDHPLLRRATREMAVRLLRRGVRVFEDPHRMMHAKLAVFDDTLAVVGTSNLDRQSLDHSCEVNAVFDGSEIAHWIVHRFGVDVLDVRPLDLAELEGRSLLAKAIDRSAAFFARL